MTNEELSARLAASETAGWVPLTQPDGTVYCDICMFWDRDTKRRDNKAFVKVLRDETGIQVFFKYDTNRPHRLDYVLPDHETLIKTELALRGLL